MNYSYILSKMYADKEWTMDGNSYEGLTWLDESPKPTNEELIEAYETYKAENEYKEKREAEYPSVNKQLEMLWDAIDSGTPLKQSEFYTKIKEIKDKYPKGVSNGQ